MFKIAAILMGWLAFAPAAEKARTTAPDSVVLDALKAEMTRSMELFKKQPTPPYYLAFEISETESDRVTGSFGTLTGSTGTKRRNLDIDLRVGSPELDNTRRIRGSLFNMMDIRSAIDIPLEDDADAIRAAIWYHTDQKYKRAVEQLIAVKTNVKVKIENTDKAGDFSKAPVETYTEPLPKPTAFDRKPWEDKVRKYTDLFRRYGNIYEATAVLSRNVETRWFVNSDGSAIQTSNTIYRLAVTGFAKASDGMTLPKVTTWSSHTLEGLPDDATVLAEADRMAKELMRLKLAPEMEPYTGPAILSAKAAGVFFHEIFGHRIEGQRNKNEEESMTFRDKVGQPVLPAFLSVYADPTVRRFGKTDLVGAYKFDNEGVKARRVNIVENGILKNFLMSRQPIDGFPESNGHGRRQPGVAAAGRQSNVFVEASKSVSNAELKKLLIEEVKKQGLKYGLFIDEVTGGFTNPGRTQPNSFNVTPTVVYRVYPDGTEELVRGVDLIGTPLTAFSKILAAGNEAVPFNGMCGAESGMVPVALVSPAMLVAQVEVQRKPKSQERSPILAPPFDDK